MPETIFGGAESSSDVRAVHAARASAAASLAGGLIAASGRAHTLREAVHIYQDVYWALWPEHGHPRYEAWARDENRYEKTYG
jgi:hypothetical protein